MLMQQSWAKELNPVLGQPLLQGSLLLNIALTAGANTFNHYLGRQMLGWFVTDQNGGASIYRSQPMNSQTLTLTSDAIVTINLWVF